MREPTNEVKIERDIRVTMPDGVELLTDIFYPVGIEDAPTILERTPYGRAGVSGTGFGPMLAERGYRYVLQASRGTDGSGGSHSYFQEVPDGRATADWIAEQSWFDGNLGTYGGSYMGYTQWALASTRPPYLKAMAVALCGSVRRFAWYPGGSYALEIIIPWDIGAVNFNKPQPQAAADHSPDAIAQRMTNLKAGFDHLPLGDAIKFLSGEDLPLFHDQLAHGDPDDPYWAPLDFHNMLATWEVPTLLVDGWQDYQCPQMLDDYVALRAGGTPVWIRIGAGGHIGGGGEGGMTEAPLLWFDTHLKVMTGLLPERTVTLEVLGEGGGWRDFEAWPPASTATQWSLHPEGRLSTDALKGAHEPDRYRYDPADPTPSVGGIGMLTGGSRDNRELETRPDVLVYTGEVLDRALEIVGPVHADLHVLSSLDHTDFFVRVCDVYPDGRSMNVCDGLQRFTPSSITRASDGSFRASVPMWPAAYRFAPGHRVRVQVSSGSHPVYARNLGTGESVFTATTMQAADQAVFHDSVVVLPHA